MYSLSRIHPRTKSPRCSASEYKDKLKGFYVARKEARETQNHVMSISSKGYITKQKEIELVSRYEGMIIGINNFVKYIIRKQKSEK